MLIAQSTIKPLHSYLSPHLLSTTSAHPCYKQCCLEGVHEDDVKMLWSSRRMQPPVDCLWSLEPLFPGYSAILWQSSLFLRDIVSVIHLYVTICMKLDPDMHIGLHLVFFGKTGVTAPVTATVGVDSEVALRLGWQRIDSIHGGGFAAFASLLSHGGAGQSGQGERGNHTAWTFLLHHLPYRRRPHRARCCCRDCGRWASFIYYVGQFLSRYLFVLLGCWWGGEGAAAGRRGACGGQAVATFQGNTRGLRWTKRVDGTVGVSRMMSAMTWIAESWDNWLVGCSY
jgi:hypothetical protein